MNKTASLINKIAEYFEVRSYLQLGLPNINTFKDIAVQFKVGVDEKYTAKNTEEIAGAHILTLAADSFLLTWESSEMAHQHEKFDLIYLHDCHCFAGTLDAFVQSLSVAHPDSIWLLDNTVPQDPYAAYPDKHRCIEWKKFACFGSKAWQGDVFKCVIAIHDKYPEISYCTITEPPNSLTVFWKAPPLPERRPAFDSIQAIAGLDYFAMLARAKLLMPIPGEALLPVIGMSLAPDLNPDPTLWKKLVFAPRWKKLIFRPNSSFPNKPQRIILAGYQPVLKLFSRPDAYKMYVKEPSAFFARTRHPVNKVVCSLLGCLGPNPRKNTG